MHADIDQKRHEQKKKDGYERTQSVRSFSQRSLRLDDTSCLSRNVREFLWVFFVNENILFCMFYVFQIKMTFSFPVQARPSARGAESTYFNSGGSVLSSPRFNTSFKCTQVVYPTQIGTASPNCQPLSELSYKSPKSQRHHLTLSCATSSSQDKFKSFQDPTQKTYSGDILLKHSHCFTQEKPFTPRTLKTDFKSTLCTYRYYTPADRKGAEEKTLSKSKQPDTPHRRYNITNHLFISG